jgi:hypothetical protein
MTPVQALQGPYIDKWVMQVKMRKQGQIDLLLVILMALTHGDADVFIDIKTINRHG